jgi:CheY-like chemotaxis protein
MDARDRLLIVENDPLLTHAVELAAEKLNLLPVVASDGWDAIDRLQSSQYLAVVVDGDIPERSGLGVLDYIREEFGEGSLDRVLLLTRSERMALELRDPVHILRTTDHVEALAIAIDEVGRGKPETRSQKPEEKAKAEARS